MNQTPKKLRFFALLITLLLSVSTFVTAQTAPDAGVKKLPPPNYVRSRDIDIKHVAIDLRFDWDKAQAYGNTVVTLAPFKDLNKFTLDAAQMQINSVTLLNGTPLKFNYAGGASDNNLEIVLDKTYKAGADLAVKVDYRTFYVNKADNETPIGAFGGGIRFIKPTADEPNKPRQIWSQGETEFNRYWFPSYDAPNDFRTSELRATVEKPYTVISNGKLIETKENADNTRTFYWKMDIPYSNYLTSIVVGDYTEIKNGEYDGVPVYAYGYPSEAKEVAETTKRVPAMIKFFSEKTGVKYAYPKYSQTMVEDFGGGMENISATTQIEEMIHDSRELLDEDSDSLQSHELAHQWFGDYVTTRDWGQIWLNESFATYFQALWDEESKGKDYFLYKDIRSNHDQVLGSWNRGSRRPIVTKYYANKDAMFDGYAYPGGGSILHTLRKHLGDELFFKSLNHYLSQNAHQPVSTEELRIAIEETTGQSMDWFFDQWLYKMGHPIFEITKSYDAAAKKLTLNVKQTQKIDPKNEFPQTEFFQALVDVEVDGTMQRVSLKPQAENVFIFDSPIEPKLVNFDYESALLKEMKFDKSTDELVYQAVNDKDALGRNWALSELSKKIASAPADKEKIAAALRTMAEKDSLSFNRQDAIAQIGAVNAPAGNNSAFKLDAATVQTLKTAAKDQNPLVRADAIELLGATGDAQYADLYAAALNDQSYTVIDKAAAALGATKNAKAYDALMKLTTTASWHGRILNAGLDGLAALGDKRSFETGYKLATDKTQPISVRTKSLSIIAETGKNDQRAFPLIFDQFKKSLASDSQRGLQNSISAIIKLGDPRGQEAFDLLKAKYKDRPQVLAFIAQYEAQFKASIGK